MQEVQAQIEAGLRAGTEIRVDQVSLFEFLVMRLLVYVVQKIKPFKEHVAHLKSNG